MTAADKANELKYHRMTLTQSCAREEAFREAAEILRREAGAAWVSDEEQKAWTLKDAAALLEIEAKKCAQRSDEIRAEIVRVDALPVDDEPAPE